MNSEEKSQLDASQMPNCASDARLDENQSQGCGCSSSYSSSCSPSPIDVKRMLAEYKPYQKTPEGEPYQGVGCYGAGQMVGGALDQAPWLLCPDCFYCLGTQYEQAKKQGDYWLTCPECGASHITGQVAIGQYQKAMGKNVHLKWPWGLIVLAFVVTCVPIAGLYGLAFVMPFLLIACPFVGFRQAKENAWWYVVHQSMGREAFDRKRLLGFGLIYGMAYAGTIILTGVAGCSCSFALLSIADPFGGY